MSNPFFQLGAIFAGLILLAFVALEGKSVGQSVGLIEPDEDPVLVFKIPDPQNFATVRAAIADSRVLEETEKGFSLVNARVYVKDVKDAGELIKTGGWVSKPIQIVGLGMDRKSEGGDGAVSGIFGGGSKKGMSQEERMAHLRRLVHKPSLNRLEQVFVLKAMNDGLEI